MGEAGEVIVAAGGGSKETPVGRRAGWGISYGTDGPRNVPGPVHGEMQTSQTAEAVAVAQATSRATSQITSLTSSRRVQGKVQNNIAGWVPWGWYEQVWNEVWQKRHNMITVTWLTAHLEGEETDDTARSEGYAPDWQTQSRGADHLGSEGFQEHEEDPTDTTLRQWRTNQVLEIWRYL